MDVANWPQLLVGGIKDELDSSNSNGTCMPNTSIHGSGRR